MFYFFIHFFVISIVFYLYFCSIPFKYLMLITYIRRNSIWREGVERNASHQENNLSTIVSICVSVPLLMLQLFFYLPHFQSSIFTLTFCCLLSTQITYYYRLLVLLVFFLIFPSRIFIFCLVLVAFIFETTPKNLFVPEILYFRKVCIARICLLL